MAARTDRRVCTECGTEFAVDEHSKAARRCPACRKRAFGSRYYAWFKGEGERTVAVRVEVRGSLPRPIPYDPPRRPPRPTPAWLKGVG